MQSNVKNEYIGNVNVKSECRNRRMLGVNVLIGGILGVNVLIGAMSGVNVGMGEC